MLITQNKKFKFQKKISKYFYIILVKNKNYYKLYVNKNYELNK